MTTGLSKILEYESEGQIWKIIPDTKEQKIILEIRDGDNREVKFSALDYAKGAIIWEDLQFEEEWLTSIYGASGGNAYFFEFEDAEIPQPKGIIAVVIRDKDILWYHENYILEKILQKELLVSEEREGEKHFFYLNVDDGEIKKTKPEGEKTLTEKEEILSPLKYEEGNEHFETIKKFLNDMLNAEPFGIIDYLEINGLIILGFYKKDKNGIISNLLILNLEGEILFETILEIGLKGIGENIFSVLNNKCLIFLEGKTKVVGLDVSQSA
ncbi:MAG: DUF4905 domain-containing protein [Flammeovirgaceae bacterium]|nr:DUF4905 domain-containing protein [Flammeovirgaceae bacterium]